MKTESRIEGRIFYTFSTSVPSVTFWIPVKAKYVCMSMPAGCGEENSIGIYDEICFATGPRMISELDLGTHPGMAARLHYIVRGIEPFVSSKAQNCGACFDREQDTVRRSGLATEIRDFLGGAYEIVAADDHVAKMYLEHASSARAAKNIAKME